MSKVWHRLKAYLRHDFREIINPTSLPNPPEYVPPGKMTWSETWQDIQEANEKYWRTWQPVQETKEGAEFEKEKHDRSLKDELSQTAQAAMQRGQGLKPMLQQIYETRARSYRDAVQEFVEGYKEGYVGQPAAKAGSNPEDGSRQENTSELSTETANNCSDLQKPKSTT